MPTASPRRVGAQRGDFQALNRVVILFRLSRFHALGQPPIQDDHFAEVAEHDVLRFQIPMHDAPPCRIVNRVADVHEGIEQLRQLERIGLARFPPFVIRLESLLERLATQKPHGVIRLPGVVATFELVDGDNIGMFQLAGDPCFTDEAPSGGGVGRLVGANVLQRDFALQIRIER